MIPEMDEEDVVDPDQPPPKNVLDVEGLDKGLGIGLDEQL